MEDLDEYEPDNNGALDLKYQGLSALEPRVLSFGGNLVVLDLSFNLLETLPEAISKLTSLQELYLSNNKLSSLPESIGSLSSLRVIKANNNVLTTLPSIGSLKNLEKLLLNNNVLTSLPEDIGYCSRLRVLHAQNNALSQLPVSLALLKAQLSDMDVSQNDESMDIVLPSAIHKDSQSILWILALQREKSHVIETLSADVKRLQHDIVDTNEALAVAKEQVLQLQERKKMLEDDLDSVRYFLCVREHCRKLRTRSSALYQSVRAACARRYIDGQPNGSDIDV
jgi:hypothetical protein